MDTAPTPALRDQLTHVIAGMAEAVCTRPGESQTRAFERCRAVTASILAFEPRDTVEAMLAGHCVMFHEMIVDSVHTTLLGEDDKTRRATRSNIVAMDRAFANNLTRLQRHRTGEAKPAPRAQSTGGDLAETEIADRILRHEAETPAETLPAEPAEAWADPTAGMNRQMRRAYMREARKRGFTTRPGVSPVRNAPATTTSATKVG